MQVFSSPNTAPLNAIVTATVNAFNNRSAVESKQLSAIDKNRLLANDPLYVEVGPYNVFYRTCVALAASINKDETKAFFKLSDIQLDAITKRVKTSLETNHKDTWAALNDIELQIRKMAYTVPELAQVKTTAPKDEPKEVVRTYRPSTEIKPLVLQDPAPAKKTVALPVATKRTETEKHPPLSREKQIEAEAKPSQAMARAAAAASEPKATKPVERKKREELTLNPDITGLNLATISIRLPKLYDELGMGHVSKEELSNVKFATENALRLRGLIAYTAYRALPSANHNLDRISSAAFLNRTSVSNILAVVEKKVEKSDPDTIRFLRAAGDELGLTTHQKALLLDPKEPRFKTWLDLQSLIAPKGQTSLQTPEGP